MFAQVVRRAQLDGFGGNIFAAAAGHEDDRRQVRHFAEGAQPIEAVFNAKHEVEQHDVEFRPAEIARRAAKGDRIVLGDLGIRPFDFDEMCRQRPKIRRIVNDQHIHVKSPLTSSPVLCF